ncbi:DinB family protein [Pseudovibrio denitrificans]|uniref:DinB family protein n=1 Tax=Pseudovibrio denitrificans TaxID=258256 RepID=UPI00278C0EEA|nr:DinB family protein [Pseudovibrio denitrificans]
MYSDFKLLAQYNTWMNTRLYTCAEQLSEEQLKEDRGAFFQSIFATFNHIVVGDLTCCAVSPSIPQATKACRNWSHFQYQQLLPPSLLKTGRS